jgi:hypothetical protein
VTAPTVGGHRLIRKLGEGVRAEVMLAHSQVEGGGTAAMKLYRAGVADESVLTEIEALTRAQGPHVVELVDVATDNAGQLAPVLARMPGASLARLLRERSELALGEAITILAPIATTIGAAHRVGVGHGGIRAEAVAFDGSGAPVLMCFGRAVLFDPGLPPALLEAQPATEVDLVGFRQLATVVLGSVGAAGRSAAEEVLRTLSELAGEQHPVVPDGLFDRLAATLLASGAALPVRLDASENSPGRDLVPGRTHTAPAVRIEGQPLPAATRTGAALARARQLGAAARRLAPADIVDRADHIVTAVRAIAAGLPTVRRRVWVAAGAVVAALLIALVAVPNARPTALASGAQGGVQAGAASSALNDSGATRLPTVAASEANGITQDDPVAAVVALFAARERCIRDLSVLCLDAVAQVGSMALAADQSVVRALQSGAELPAPLIVTSAQVELTERLGDSAILALSDVPDSAPTTVLLMKSAVGWRIRDYLD